MSSFQFSETKKNIIRIKIPSNLHPYITEVIACPFGDGLYTFFFLQDGQKEIEEATEMCTSIESLYNEHTTIARHIMQRVKKTETAMQNLKKIQKRTGRPSDDLVQLSVRLDRTSIEKIEHVTKTKNTKNKSESLRYIIDQYEV